MPGEDSCKVLITCMQIKTLPLSVCWSQTYSATNDVSTKNQKESILTEANLIMPDPLIRRNEGHIRLGVENFRD